MTTPLPPQVLKTDTGIASSRKQASQPVVRVNLATMEQAVREIVEMASRKRGFTVFTLNLDHLAKLRIDKAFHAAYSRARFITADGWPVVWLGRRMGAELERTAGSDLVLPLCEKAAEEGLSIYLFGSSDEALQKAKTRLQKQIPHLRIAGMEAPGRDFDPFSLEADRAMQRIASSGADLCFVALGAPKQELFADRAALQHPSLGYLGVGAALDFIAGHQHRAPRWMRRTGLEWLYRLLANPRRLAGRYGRSALVFADMAVRQQIGLSDAKSRFSVKELCK